MKVGVVGKGGSGKTSVAGMLARSFASSGHQVIALDCDANPNLGISIGLGLEPTERLIAIREGLDDGSVEHASTAEQVLDRFGATGPDGVRMAVVTKIDAPQSGCT